METDQTKISQYVRDLLTIAGYVEEDNPRLWFVLYHQYCAVAAYEVTTADERTQIRLLQPKLRYFFTSNFTLKERKRKTKAKDIPPTPPIEKEKEKEIEEKTTHSADTRFSDDFSVRHEQFRQQCLQFVGKYDNMRVADFFNYWSEVSHHAGKMRFEMQRFWNIDKRMARWVNTQYAAKDTAAAIRLRRLRKKQAEEQAEADAARQAAEQREAENALREAQSKADRQGATTGDEYMKNNPTGILATIAREREKREALKGKKK